MASKGVESLRYQIRCVDHRKHKLQLDYLATSAPVAQWIESVRLLTGRSWVRIPAGAFINRKQSVTGFSISPISSRWPRSTHASPGIVLCVDQVPVPVPHQPNGADRDPVNPGPTLFQYFTIAYSGFDEEPGDGYRRGLILLNRAKGSEDYVRTRVSAT